MNLKENSNNIEESNYDTLLYTISNWDELDIDNDILRGIYAYGFEKPSPIQTKAIKPIISGKDIIAQAQSGTGKTAAFTIGALSTVNLLDNFTQVLVLSPTRELCSQTASVINSIGSMMKGLRVHTLFGGTFIEDNQDNVKLVPHIICGCPGKVYDMMRRNKITSYQIKLLILDEADEMLSDGFKEQIYSIFQYFNSNIQVALFSATLPNNIYSITSQFMRNPVKICVKTESLTLEGISQYFIGIDDDKQKYLVLKDLYSYISLSQCIIYCNSVKRVSDLYDAMLEDEFPVCCIHSNMEKQERDNSFIDFKNGKYRVLISSDITARGIDIQQVSVVINFDISNCVHKYLHRIGRSGRWGRKGVGINLVTRRDVSKIKDIESYYSCQINEMPANFNINQS
jgi:superfamily II DNA/RNA helicase